jgi:peptidoglycan/LPS O-acetylase OafA/YrhL
MIKIVVLSRPKLQQLQTLDEVISHSSVNNFNLIRLMMALGVLYDHSFAIFESSSYRDVAGYFLHFHHSGSLSVSVFFMISGLLLTQSFFKTSSQFKFILKRLLRLFPALIVCVWFTVFIAGALGTELKLTQYFSSKDTYRYFYNILLSNEYIQFSIPGSFNANKCAGVINGSLWTLPFEFTCYIFLFFILFMISFASDIKNSLIFKITAGILGLFFLVYILNGRILLERVVGLATGFNPDYRIANNPLPLFLFFFTGCFLYFIKTRIKRSRLTLMLIFITYTGTFMVYEGTIINWIAEYVLIVYGVIMLAGARSIRKLNSKIDPSYGVYLYAWPIQQIAAFYLPAISAYSSMLITIPASLLLGTISYVYVEKPMMNKVTSINNLFNRRT